MGDITNLFNNDWRFSQFMRKGELIAGILRTPEFGGTCSAAIFRGDGILMAGIFFEEEHLPYFRSEIREVLESRGWTLVKVQNSTRYVLFNDLGVEGDYFAVAKVLDDALPVLSVKGWVMGDVGIDIASRDIPDWYTPGQEYEYGIIPVEPDEDFVWHQESPTGDTYYRGNFAPAEGQKL